MNVEEILRTLARENVQARPAFKAGLTERLIEALSLRPRLLGRRFALAGVALLLVLAVVGWLLTPQVPSWATLITEQGEAQIAWQRPLYFRWSRSGTASVPAGQEFRLATGDRVILSEDGAGFILFPDGSQLHLAGGTALTLEEIDAVRLVIRVDIETGEVKADVPSLPGRRVMEVRTPAATVSVRGTVFRTRIVTADHTYSATDEGTTRVVLLDPDQGYPSVDVPAGYEVDAVIGQPLQVRPQAPLIDHLTLDGAEVPAGSILVSNRPVLEILGRTRPGPGDVVLMVEERVVDRAPIVPGGEFRLRFRASVEGEYAFCIIVEAPDGARSPCVSLSYCYDITPPAVLRLLEPSTPEIVGETVTLRGETEPGMAVRLNGEPLPVDPTGVFATPWTLRPGENPMTLEACDAAGNCARLEFTLVRQ